MLKSRNRKIARGDIAVTGAYVTSVLIVSAFVFALKSVARIATIQRCLSIILIL